MGNKNESLTISQAIQPAKPILKKYFKIGILLALAINIGFFAAFFISGGYFGNSESYGTSIDGLGIVMRLPTFIGIDVIVCLVVLFFSARRGLNKFRELNDEKYDNDLKEKEQRRLAELRKTMTDAEWALYEVQLQNQKLLRDIKNKPSKSSPQWVRGITYDINGEN